MGGVARCAATPCCRSLFRRVWWVARRPMFTARYNAHMPEPMPLEYAEPPRRAWRVFYVLLLPLLWLPAGIGSRIHYGDEYGPFIVAQLPALPVVYFLEHRLEMEALFLLAMAINFALMIVVGYLMDRVRVWRFASVLFPPVLLGLVLARWFVMDTIPPRQRPWPPGVEWEPVFLFPAWAWAVYGFGLLSLTIALLARIVRRVVGRRH
jgi:hypothetical protein